MNIITPELIDNLRKYMRLTNYLGAAQLYLRNNCLLEKPLTKDDIKRRVLGHWGTVPGLNFIYTNANILIKRHKFESMFVAGPGHGFPAILANLFLEGTLGEYYPKYMIRKVGFENLIHDFSWPNGFPSHVNPDVPGAILEGGELGYSLATAHGAVMDNPDLLAFAVVGDGEAETATLATSWHSPKFMDPRTCGAVLPILHLNKYKISGPTIFGTMSNHELMNLFTGYGYNPIIVDEDGIEEKMILAMEKAYQEIHSIQTDARINNIIDKPRWPMIIMRSLKGWSGPKVFKGQMIEDSFRSHGIPLENPQTDEAEFLTLKAWLESYKVHELLDSNHQPITEIRNLIPEGNLRMGKNKSANGERIAASHLPNATNYTIPIDTKGKPLASSMKNLAIYLRDVIKLNPETFRIMSPDETESNKLHALFEITKRAYIWPSLKGAENVAPDGRVMEVLSENLLMGWMQGYVLTGRQSIFISYEAFAMIIASMLDQYAKFMAKAELVKWRNPLPSLNFILTSNSWRQDHNGFSHQNPGFVSNALNKHANVVNIFFPVDANSLVATIEENLKSTNKINIVIAGKTDLPQYLTLNEAKAQHKTGVAVWEWAGNNSDQPDVIFAATGDYMTFESLAAIKILREIAPEINTRFVSVNELTAFGIGDNFNISKIDRTQFDAIFTADKEILYNYHGFPEDIKQLIFNHPAASRFHINGYIEKGTTTTPFDMMVQNHCSRYDLAIDAINFAVIQNPSLKKKASGYLNYFKALLSKHEIFIQEHGFDMPEITEFKLVKDLPDAK
jgi:xylulose-5-phosphate/fructose-6-phosphate phosphoketolase